MKISDLTPENTILTELGSRLARIRKQRRLTQQQLADDAGLGVATLARMEKGQDAQLESWIKILRSLDMLQSVDALLPENYESPMTEVIGKRRRRTDSPATWGDQSR